jgi:hypothetical protein
MNWMKRISLSASRYKIMSFLAKKSLSNGASFTCGGDYARFRLTFSHGNVQSHAMIDGAAIRCKNYAPQVSMQRELGFMTPAPTFD